MNNIFSNTSISRFIFSLLFFSIGYLNCQIKTIKAVGGKGKKVDWEEEKRNEDPNGPGYFYNDCAQSLESLKASSTLANQGKFNYKVENLSDNDPMTAWEEGKADYGIGEYFEVKAESVNKIYNGYQSSPKRWMENSRVKKFKVYKNGKPICFLELTDEMGEQYFELPLSNTQGLQTYRFEVVDVYKGTKWPDVAISEIQHVLCCFSEETEIAAEINLSFINLKDGCSITAVDPNSGEFKKTEIIKTTNQNHVRLIELSTESKTICLTLDHPLYIKGFGFSSVNNFMRINGIIDCDDLVNNIEFLVVDESGNNLIYEKLKKVSIKEGLFKTFSIMKLKEGNSFIANGFVTKTY
ncbi:MAG: NADase-type glycan-binding domain-containing protein [Bacteroidota bacterium]